MAVVRKYRNRWVVDFRDQNGRRCIETPKGPFESVAIEKRAAHELLQHRLAEVTSGCYAPKAGRLTFEQVAERWMDSKVKIADATRSDYRIMLDCYLLPYFGPRPLQAISRFHLERFRSEMGEGVPDAVLRAREAKLREIKAVDSKARLKPLDPGARTTNKCLSVLAAIFGYAVRHTLLPNNVAERLEKLPTEEGESRVIEENVLAPDELSQVLLRAKDPFRIPIALAIYCGLRQAEVLGLQWADIDWERGTAAVRRTQRRKKFLKTKTAASRRTVELPEPLLRMLNEWRPRCPKSVNHLVCPSVTGLPMQGSALLQRGLHPALVRGGLRRVRYHDLRHSFASNLLVSGVDIVTVSKALGHANVQITLSTYAHAVPKARQGASDRMALLLAQSGNNLETSGSRTRAPGVPTQA